VAFLLFPKDPKSIQSLKWQSQSQFMLNLQKMNCSNLHMNCQALDVSEKSEEPRFDLQCELEPIKVRAKSCDMSGMSGMSC
jgi:hypothetical protein